MNVVLASVYVDSKVKFEPIVIEIVNDKLVFKSDTLNIEILQKILGNIV